MKIKHIIAALALSIPGLVAAVPADPRPRTITNPDGSTITVRVHGNEFFHFMTDAGCTRILEKDSRGFIVDAVRDGVSLSFSKADVDKLRAEKEISSASNPASGATPMKRMATLDFEGRSNYPTIGKGNRSLVVLVEFQDVDFTVADPKGYFTRQLNERGFSDYGASGSAIDYYLDASNGLYAPQFDVYGPVKVSKEAAYFKDLNSSAMSLLVRESLTQLHDNGEIDYSHYDFDEDGVIDTVFFYYAGYGSADSDTETIWPHQYDYRYFNTGFGMKPLQFDGKRVGPYACANELKGLNPATGKEPWKDGSDPWVEGIGTFVHEYGHVLGLPDLYDVDYTEGVEVDTPENWDVMAQGCYNFNGCIPPLYSAYEQWVCRWLDYTEASDASSYSLAALGHTDTPSAVRISIPNSSSGDTFEPEYFVIEARDKSKWDACFPESGIMIWRINYNKNQWLNNTVNSKNGSNVKIHYAFDRNRPLFKEGYIYPGGKSELMPTKDYEFWKSPIISSMSYDDDTKTGSFDYNMVRSVPYGAPLLHDNPFAAEDGSRGFTLKWDPVEGAGSYLLTIRRVSNGQPYADYDEYNVGDVTSLSVKGVPLAVWVNELEVYVRAVKVIPCADTSNVIKFVPKSLPKESEVGAVDGIGQDNVVVSGGVGCINAPDGAEIYDLTGKRLCKDGLSAGVYVVVYGGRSWKVSVR